MKTDILGLVVYTHIDMQHWRANRTTHNSTARITNYFPVFRWLFAVSKDVSNKNSYVL